jgi:hypothetical protein
MYVGRMRCGLTCSELAGRAGVGTAAAAKAVQRMAARLPGDRRLAANLRAVLRKIEAER